MSMTVLALGGLSAGLALGLILTGRAVLRLRTRLAAAERVTESVAAQGTHDDLVRRLHEGERRERELTARLLDAEDRCRELGARLCDAGLPLDAPAPADDRWELPEHERAMAVPADGATVARTETVLLAEDDDGVRTMVAEALREAGFGVLEAADGEEALRRAETWAGPVDVLVTDMRMPGLGGRQLARRLFERYPRLAVLYVSAEVDTEAARRALTGAHEEFLPKPVELEVLLGVVRELLRARQGARR